MIRRVHHVHMISIAMALSWVKAAEFLFLKSMSTLKRAERRFIVKLQDKVCHLMGSILQHRTHLELECSVQLNLH